MKVLKKLFINISFFGFFLVNNITFSQTNPLRINNVDYFEADYTIPSFTELRRRYTAANISNPSAALIIARQTAIDNLRAKETPYNVVMNLYDDPTSKMAFNWITNAGITGGKVQIVQGKVSNESAFATPLLTVNATCTPLNNVIYNVSGNSLNSAAGIPNNTQKSYTENKALVTGLTQNTTYSFRVGKEGFWSEIGTFTTSRNNKDSFSFIYVTDSQVQTYYEFQTVQRSANAAFNTNPNASFWVHCGDLVQTTTGATWEWEQFFEMLQANLFKLPFAPVAGNHDNGAPVPLFTKHFYTNSPDFDRNGLNSARTPGSTYSYVYGDALFFAINSHEESSYCNAILAWMRTEVAKHSDKKWRIAYFHTAAYTGSLGSGDYQASSGIRSWRERISPVLDELEIDIALQGHAHVYEVIGPVKNKQLVGNTVSNQQTVPVHTTNNLTGKIGGTFNTTEGTLYFLNRSMGPYGYSPKPLNQMDNMGSTGVTNYRNLFTGRFGQPDNPTFSNITVSTDAIVISTYEVSSNGNVSLFDEIKVVKSFTGTTNAQTPNITAHPQPATYNQNETATALSVSASVTDGGTLTYQWYSNTTNSNTNGTSITGATSSTYTPSTATVGTKHYYVEVTNTNNSVNGTKTSIITSNTASITVNNLVNAQMPNITAHPQPATYNQNETATALSVSASVTDGGTLTYQWYSNTTNSNTNGTSITGATSSTYTPSTATVGTKHYYVEVTNTNNSVNGTKTAIITSNTASITVNNLVNAQMPNITAHPQPATYNQNETATALSVSASVTDGGTLTYQWYSNTTNSNTNGTSITGATSRTYTLSTATVGTKHYYVEVTNTNNSVNGRKNATVSSNTASVTVENVTNAEDHFFTNLKVYPNPFTGIAYLTSAVGCSLQVINAAGIIVHTQLVITRNQSIHLEHLPDGVYFFLLEKEGKTKTLKVVKK